MTVYLRSASWQHGWTVRIVEDDPYWLLVDAPPPPIATFAPEQVYCISSLSKCLTPGLRVAFVLIRDPHERERFLVAPRSFALMVAPLTGALATQWILDGSADELMDGVRDEVRLRHRMARDILAGRYSGAGDGLHVCFNGCLICLRGGPSRSALLWFNCPGNTVLHSGALAMWSPIGLRPQCLFIVRPRAKVSTLEDSDVSRAAHRPPCC